MKQADREMLKAKLLEMQAGLEDLELISKSSADTVVLDQTSVGRLSRMDAMQAQQMALETERRRSIQLQQIKAALIRLESGDFGYCTHCDQAIAIGRLAVNPVATRCVKCPSADMTVG